MSARTTVKRQAAFPCGVCGKKVIIGDGWDFFGLDVRAHDSFGAEGQNYAIHPDCEEAIKKNTLASEPWRGHIESGLPHRVAAGQDVRRFEVWFDYAEQKSYVVDAAAVRESITA